MVWNIMEFCKFNKNSIKNTENVPEFLRLFWNLFKVLGYSGMGSNLLTYYGVYSCLRCRESSEFFWIIPEYSGISLSFEFNNISMINLSYLN